MTVDDIPTAPAATDDFAAAWRAWHEEKDIALADPHGFLAVTGVGWLTADPQRVPGAPGTWATGPGGPVVVLDEGEQLLVDGVLVTGRHEFGVLPERGGVLAGYGNAVVEVARRGGNDIDARRHRQFRRLGQEVTQHAPREAVRFRPAADDQHLFGASRGHVEQPVLFGLQVGQFV